MGHLLLQGHAVRIKECRGNISKVALFHDMIHHEIEVYMDDMIDRSQTEEEHLDHLHKLFERLKNYKVES